MSESIAAQEVCQFHSYLQSVFTTRGEGWTEKKVGEIAIHSLGKMLDRNKNKGEFREYLRNQNVQWFNFNIENIAKMRFLESEIEKYSAKYSDLLICEGGYPGRAAIWEKNAHATIP